MAFELDSVFAIADTGFRLVLVERLQAGRSSAWEPRCFSDHRLYVEIKSLSQEETQELSQEVLGKQTPNLSEISDAIFRKSLGNPKQIWLQLRALQLNKTQATKEAIISGYDETILNLPALDRLALQLVTLLMGNLRLEDLVWILRRSCIHSQKKIFGKLFLILRWLVY